jgi:hypothetical protein
MQQLTLAAFEAVAEDFDADVASSPHIDHFCASSAWCVPFFKAFGEPSDAPMVLRSDAGWAALALRHVEGVGRVWSPLEAMWLLSLPVLASRDAGARGLSAVALDLARHTVANRGAWDALWLSGLPSEGPTTASLAQALAPVARLYVGPTASRHVARLEDGGFDAWYARRSPEFRKKTRQEVRRAEADGLRITRFTADAATAGPGDVLVRDASEADALYARILAIEARSWKGQIGSGFVDGGMRAFYSHMLPRLATRGTLRAQIGQLGGADVCFLFGGLFAAREAATFRGLQMSFDAEHRQRGLGNIMQLKMLQWLSETGAATRYDLGSDMAYKQRWSDGTHDTQTIVARPR